MGTSPGHVLMERVSDRVRGTAAGGPQVPFTHSLKLGFNVFASGGHGIAATRSELQGHVGPRPRSPRCVRLGAAIDGSKAMPV